jgi:hypothetical protein
MFNYLYAKQFEEIHNNPNATRSSKLIAPMHEAIANFVKSNSNYKVIALPSSEYEFSSILGTKKVDVAVFDKEGKKLLGVIMFKGIRSEYNKNANNYYETMKGESSLFVEAGIPVFQVVFIPTKVKHKTAKGMGFEEPTEKSFKNYENFINHKSSYWNLLKLSVYYFDIDYNNFIANYSDKIVKGVEPTLEEGLLRFIGGLDG